VSQQKTTLGTFGFNIFLLITINALIKPFYLFGIDRTVQNDLGAEGYGLYWVYFNFVFLFQIVGDLGVQNFSQQWISRQRGSVQSTLPRTLGFKFVLTGLFMAVVLAFGFLQGHVQENPFIFLLICLNFVLNSWVMFLRTKVSGLGHYTLDSVLSALDKLIVILIMSYWIWGSVEGYDLTDFILAQTIGYGLVVLVLWIWIRVKLGRLSINWSKTSMLAILKRTYPYALAVFLMTIFTRIDVVMLDNLLTDAAYHAGVYAGGMRLLDAANTLGLLFAGLLLPMYSNASRSGQPPRELAVSAWHLLFSIAFPVSVICWVFGTEIAELLYTEADAYWGKVLAILMLTFVIRSTDYVFGSLLTAYERLSFMNRIFGWAVLINVGMNFWLIPMYQAEGAAYATLISQAFVVVIFFWAAHRYILQTGLWGALAKGVLFATLCLLSVGFIRQIDGSWMFQVLLILLASGILSLLLGMVQPLFAWIRIGKKE